MLKASDVAGRFRKITPVDRIIRDILKNIMREINNQTNSGRTVVRYVLQKLFDDIGDLSGRDIRSLVYAGVIKRLEELEYIVKLIIEDDKRPVLLISTGIDIAKEMDVETAKEYVKRHNPKVVAKRQRPTPITARDRAVTPRKPPNTDFKFSQNNGDVFDILNQFD